MLIYMIIVLKQFFDMPISIESVETNYIYFCTSPPFFSNYFVYVKMCACKILYINQLTQLFSEFVYLCLMQYFFFYFSLPHCVVKRAKILHLCFVVFYTLSMSAKSLEVSCRIHSFGRLAVWWSKRLLRRETTRTMIGKNV